MMQGVIGIDIGTTLIKCSAYMSDGSYYDVYCNTPPLKRDLYDEQNITFSPKKIWNAVCNLIIPILGSISDATISVVCQAPSLCLWDEEGDGIGISYLSYYGNPTKNDYISRNQKTARRLTLANRLASKRYTYISGLTGYIVFMLTGKLTMDSITAWELGIESQKDALNMQKSCKDYIFPSILTPIEKISLNCVDLNFDKGFSLVGATDSAILPISITPEFSDYYIYLGSWGSLLESSIRSDIDYSIQYHSGILNNWLISIPDFITRVTANEKELDNLFISVKNLTNINCKIAICGGLAKKKRDYIQFLVNTHLAKRQVVFASEKGGAFGACRLAELSAKEVK